MGEGKAERSIANVPCIFPIDFTTERGFPMAFAALLVAVPFQSFELVMKRKRRVSSNAPQFPCYPKRGVSKPYLMV